MKLEKLIAKYPMNADNIIIINDPTNTIVDGLSTCETFLKVELVLSVKNKNIVKGNNNPNINKRIILVFSILNRLREKFITENKKVEDKNIFQTVL